MHYFLFYDYPPDVLQRRAPFRAAHLKLAWEASERGELILGGALAEPVDAAVLLFRCDTADIPRRFAEADPYVQNGVASAYRIRQWTTVVGADATTPLR